MPSFLANELGPEKAEAPLERTPATGVDVRIHDQGYTVSHWGVSVSVVSEDVGGDQWRRHVHGVTRDTSFGTETIVVNGRETEEFLTVTKRQGVKTWRWKLATRLHPRLGRDGSVTFLDPTRHRVTHDRHRPGPDSRRRGQGRHARRPPLESRGERLGLVADPRARRRRPAPPLRHRPSGHAPSGRHGDDDGSNLPRPRRPRRRPVQRLAGRPHRAWRQRSDQHADRLDGRRGNEQRKLHPAGHLLPRRRIVRAGVLHLDVDRDAARSRGDERLLRRQGLGTARRGRSRHDRQQHHDRHRGFDHDRGERCARPCVLLEQHEFDVLDRDRHVRALRDRDDRGRERGH